MTNAENVLELAKKWEQQAIDHRKFARIKQEQGDDLFAEAYKMYALAKEQCAEELRKELKTK